MVLPFLSFLCILFLVLQGSICLPSVLTTMVTFIQKPYVFPPIILIPQVLRFLKGQFFPCTIVVPDIRPRKFWWPLLQSYSSLQLAPKGTFRMVLPPSSEGFSPRWPLPWDLQVFGIDPLKNIHE